MPLGLTLACAFSRSRWPPAMTVAAPEPFPKTNGAVSSWTTDPNEFMIAKVHASRFDRPPKYRRSP